MILGKTVEILLVEDNKGDIGLIEEVFEEAMLYLRGKGKFSGSLRPDIVILDINLPNKDGREVLKEMKEDSNHKNIPMVVLITSNAEKDIFRTYDLHANAYITKPLGFNEFITVVESIESFWIEIVQLPSK